MSVPPEPPAPPVFPLPEELSPAGRRQRRWLRGAVLAATGVVAAVILAFLSHYIFPPKMEVKPPPVATAHPGDCRSFTTMVDRPGGAVEASGVVCMQEDRSWALVAPSRDGSGSVSVPGEPAGSASVPGEPARRDESQGGASRGTAVQGIVPPVPASPAVAPAESASSLSAPRSGASGGASGEAASPAIVLPVRKPWSQKTGTGKPG